MNLPRVEEAVHRVVPLESYRSPEVPTLRFGIPAMVTMFAPRGGRSSGTAETPSRWLATDAKSGELLVLAETAVLSPIPEFRADPPGTRPSSMHPREALAALRELLPEAAEAFFAGAEVSAASRQTLRAALASAVPGELLAWISSCCADFFSWLEADVDTVSPDAGA